jgi:osmotically-inducible protein OsmY
MKTDLQLKADVTAELDWDTAINAAGIGVMVKHGVVTLTGHLDTFAEKHAVERAGHRVAGVRAMVTVSHHGHAGLRVYQASFSPSLRR